MITTITYDNVGNVLSVTDPLNQTIEYEYDDINRQVLIKDAADYETIFVYDNGNNLISVTDANKHTTNYEYDSLDRLTKTINAQLRRSNVDL